MLLQRNLLLTLIRLVVACGRACGHKTHMQPLFYTSTHGHRIAYRQQLGEAGSMGVLFLPGFRSDMESTKATALAEYCAARDIPFTAFDYFAHGKSEGDFLEYTIGRGVADTVEMLDEVARGPQIIVGSSMGGWIGLRAALERKHQVRGLVGIAAAPDFTRQMKAQMTVAHRATMDAEGLIWVPSDFGSDYPITQAMLDDGETQCLLDDTILLDMPIHLLQGQRDEDVPWETALAINDKLLSDDVVVTLIKDGEHRLSRPQDLALLYSALERMRGLTG